MVEAFRRANPVPADRTSGRRSLPSAHALFNDVVATRARRVRTRVIVIVVAIALIALLLAAFVFVRRESKSLSIAPVCYATDTLSAPRIIAYGGDPADACAQAWKRGEVGHGPVPDFDVCVLPSGVKAVFPGESGSVCAQLDLPESSGDNRIPRFIDSVNRQVSAACLSPDQAERLIRRELARVGLEGWATKVGASDAKRPCASLFAEPALRRITIVPIANPFPSTSSTTP
jgi:hypothetical protein